MSPPNKSVSTSSNYNEVAETALVGPKPPSDYNEVLGATTVSGGDLLGT